MYLILPVRVEGNHSKATESVEGAVVETLTAPKKSSGISDGRYFSLSFHCCYGMSHPLSY